MLNTKLSIQSYQDEMWDMYILDTMKRHSTGYEKVFLLLEKISMLIITDSLPRLYNKVFETHVALKYRQQPELLLEISTHLMNKKIPLAN